MVHYILSLYFNIYICKVRYGLWSVLAYPLFQSVSLFFVAVFFPEVGGATLDSHHGFVVEYGDNRDVDLGRFFV